MAKRVKVGKFSLEELPSGSLRLRKMADGVTHTIIFDYTPREKDIIQALAEEIGNANEKKAQMSFSTAANNYIELKINILSPTTIREYRSTASRLSKEFVNKRVSDITALDVQKEINRLTKDKAPKTVHNYHGFISAVLGTYKPSLVLHTTLPQKRKNEPYIPSDEDIKRILAEVKDTAFEIPISLACYGMRRSEICALTPADINGDVVTINKAMVMDENKKWVIKTTKTVESTRDIVIHEELAKKIIDQGYVYKGHPNSITMKLKKIQTKLGIPYFSIHKLRHYFASKMSELGIPEADILKMGGWETDHIMKKVYRHSLQTQAAQRRAMNLYNDSIFNE